MENLINSLSPIEIKIAPFLKESLEEIIKKSGLDKTTVLRALKFLENKGFIKIKTEVKTLVELGINGIYYKKNQLPERKLLELIDTHNFIELKEGKSISKLSDNEFKVSLGALKNKALIEIKNGKISLIAKKEEVTKKFPEERLIELLPLEKKSLQPEQLYALKKLKARKDIIEITEKKSLNFTLTEKGKKIAGKKIKSNLLEEVTPEIIKSGTGKKQFRKYDLNARVPSIFGGRKHFVNQSIEQGKRIWLDLGFKEMSGNLIETSFWNFDALFTAQDHPVREMQDTFFIKNLEGTLPKKELVQKIKKVHEEGTAGSKGWRYKWSEEEAKKIILRTHTTSLSAHKLAMLKEKDLPAKYFAIGKVFRNETLDWSHGFEFNQSEGIVLDKNANFRHLIGYLKEFAKKMGYDKIRLQPAYFPYTEPSVEGAVWNEEKKEWLEILAAGIFRPEVTIPLLGTDIPVLAWGPGFDRLMMKAHEIKDLRKLYKNDFKHLRERKMIIK